jgi:hypothetical protein
MRRDALPLSKKLPISRIHDTGPTADLSNTPRRLGLPIQRAHWDLMRGLDVDAVGRVRTGRTGMPKEGGRRSFLDFVEPMVGAIPRISGR